MLRVAALFVVVIVAGLSPAAWAFHTLECGPFRTTLIDKNTGEKTCLDQGPGAQGQFMRFRKLQQDRERRTRDLLLQQRQQAKAQELIDLQERAKQQKFTRGHTLNQREPVRDQEKSRTIQESLTHQDQEAKRLREESLQSNLLRGQNLLEQKLELPRADLLDGQKAFNKRILKDQAVR